MSQVSLTKLSFVHVRMRELGDRGKSEDSVSYLRRTVDLQWTGGGAPKQRAVLRIAVS